MQNDSCFEAAIVLMQEDLLALRHHRGMLHPRRRVGTHVPRRLSGKSHEDRVLLIYMWRDRRYCSFGEWLLFVLTGFDPHRQHPPIHN
ncbi:hypothetical protein BCR42DRAFT_429687 [Absidia repens]|uniref:Uncharacterized protein n=1 Tax=Absidia repens TaxID=90262 RepID=A0A1X2HRA5_9FUNG|nr:hypothetical protein BCR42DRAFT_429687 [Absidia repens]